MSPALNTADQAILSLTYTPGNSLAEQLPIELISSIASFLVGSESDPDDESHTPYGLHHLVSATHVCHRWREAILNDPRLWTDIDFSTTPHASDILAQVLPRSGNLALKISASFLKADPALTQILDVSTRCDDLTLIFPYEMCEGVICQGRPFPKLRCLFLAPFGFPDIDDDPTYYPKFWESFPALKELTLSCMDAEWMRPLPSARCLETVVIEINGDARELFFDFIDILSSSETLTSVTFQAMACLVDSKNLSANSKKEVVVNKKIESLCLRDYGVRLLHYVSCPALRSFRVDTLFWLFLGVPVEIRENVMQSVIDFLVLANPPLENITLGADEFPLFALPSVLRAVPHLKAFSLRVDLFSDLSFLTEFFDELSKKCGGLFKVVPALEELSIALPVYSGDPMDDKLVEEIDGKHFVKMIQERTASCMRSLSVSAGTGGYCGLREEDVLALQECERQVDGLEIELEIDILQDDEEDGIQ